MASFGTNQALITEKYITISDQQGIIAIRMGRLMGTYKAWLAHCKLPGPCAREEGTCLQRGKITVRIVLCYLGRESWLQSKKLQSLIYQYMSATGQS